MSTTLTNPPIPAPDFGIRQVHYASDKLAGSGALLFLSALFVAGSAFANLRPSIFGLHVHPYLIPIGLAFPFVAISRVQRFPTNTLFGLLIFLATYIFSTLSGNIATSETPKIIIGGIAIFTSALLISSRTDFIAGAVGLSLAMAVVSFRGLAAEGDAAAAAIDMSNKNAFSLFALPSILLAGYITLNYATKRWIKIVLILSSIAAIVTIFSSGNRSGYLGVAVIGLMLMRRRKIFGFLLVVTVIAATAVVLTELGADDVAKDRLERTFEEKMGTDATRIELFLTSFQIGLENPIIGVSPEGLRYELGRRVMHQFTIIDPHNVFASVIGGSGVICFAALLYTGWTIANVKPASKFVDAKDPQFRQARELARLLVILWFIRGNFTREILYNPSFCLALGMVIGLCLVVGGATNPRSPRLFSTAVRQI